MARSLGKTYQGRRGAVRALGPVDLEFEGGTFTCVHGPSGSGNLSLLRNATCMCSGVMTSSDDVGSVCNHLPAPGPDCERSNA